VSSAPPESFYLVGKDWTDRWTKFTRGEGPDPGPIDNKGIYRKYFVRNEKIKLAEDFYLLTSKLWKFAYTIYGGGPVIKQIYEGTAGHKIADDYGAP